MKWTSILSTTTLIGVTLAAEVSDCSCGFIDSENGDVWTDALIVYFNETQAIPDDFKTQIFTHKREYGWNTLYRQGALEENILMDYASNGTNSQMDTLAFFIDQSTGQHLVNGAAIEAKRQDIRFGSFQASMRGPPKNTGGSAMSMMLQFNRTSNIEIDMCNMNDPKDARFLSLKDGEFPSSSMITNYTVAANGSSNATSIDPWDFVETRIDWGKHYVNWTVGGNQTRTAKRKGVDVSEPLPLIFKHWSIGDSYWMDGPPTTRNQANVAWVRAFFNSSLTTKAEQKDFDDRCRLAVTCSVNDTSLRGSTSYAEEALIPWKQPGANHSWRIISSILSGSFFAFGCLTLINVILRRIPWGAMIGKGKGKMSEKPPPELSSPSPYAIHLLGPGENKQATYGVPQQLSTVDEVEPVKDEGPEVRRRSVRWQDPFYPAGDKRASRVSGSDYPRTFSQSQPTNWRKKSLAYHGTLPDLVPHESATARKSISMRAKSGAGIGEEQPGFRPRNESVFQSIRSRAGSTLNAISEVIAQANTTENQRARAAEVRKTLLMEEEEAPKHGKTAMVEISPQESSSHSVKDFAFEEINFRQQRDRQASVLDRFRDHHFTTAARPSHVSATMKDWNTQMLHEVDQVDPLHDSQIRGPRRITLAEAVPVAAVDIPLPKQKEHEVRINYLAGLVAFSSLGVTLIHFFLTFSPYAGGLDYGQHYNSEYWARWTVEPAFLNPIWLGPFFLTSCRFLASRYLVNGDLSAVAEKMLLRAPRLIIPCVLVAALEYFFLEQGLMVWLQWLPSISWSEWPYITAYANFGVFLNSMLELMYLIPNAAPQVVSHYCTGVLWSVPVQLQFSFITLLAVVIIKDIKDYRKRFALYAWCIVANWYSLSWGSCFWAGLALADLQITYKFSHRIQQKPFYCWIFCISMWIIAFGSAAMTLLEDRLQIPTMSSEHNIHPDIYTGKHLGATTGKGYPAYFEPRLNTLTFAIAMQLLIETSTWFQAFLSMRVWQPIFPHAFTIYLIHGFIWWSLGAYMVVQIGSRGTPYWATLLSTVIVCYFTLALTVIALSFFTGTVTAAACRNIARWAMEPAVPKQRTLEPFPANLFLDRNKEVEEFPDEEAQGPTPVAATAPRPAYQRAPATTDTITNTWQMDFKDRSKSLEDIELEEVDPIENTSSSGSASGSVRSRQRSEPYYDNAN